MLSHSSKKMIAGLSLDATLKTALTYFSLSENHFEPIEAMLMCIKCAPDSVAIAFDSIVLPVPAAVKKCSASYIL
jgi:hypothetical protein